MSDHKKTMTGNCNTWKMTDQISPLEFMLLSTMRASACCGLVLSDTVCVNDILSSSKSHLYGLYWNNRSANGSSVGDRQEKALCAWRWQPGIACFTGHHQHETPHRRSYNFCFSPAAPKPLNQRLYCSMVAAHARCVSAPTCSHSLYCTSVRAVLYRVYRLRQIK